MRYNRARLNKNADGKRVHTSITIPKIESLSSDIFVEVSKYDRLDMLAHRFYNNRDLWWVIAAANNIGKGTLYITQGRIIRVPMYPMDTYNKLDEKGY